MHGSIIDTSLSPYNCKGRILMDFLIYKAIRFVVGVACKLHV